MSFPENELGRDFLVANPDEQLGTVVLRLMKQKGSDYSFLFVQTAPGTFLACQVGKLKLRLKFFPPEKLFAMKLSELSADFMQVPAVEKAETDINAARQLTQKSSLHLLVVMDGGEVIGYFWLVSRTVFPGKSLSDVLQSIQALAPAASERREFASPTSAEPHPSQNVVNTGFTNPLEPTKLLDKFNALDSGE